MLLSFFEGCSLFNISKGLVDNVAIYNKLGLNFILIRDLERQKGDSYDTQKTSYKYYSVQYNATHVRDIIIR